MAQFNKQTAKTIAPVAQKPVAPIAQKPVAPVAKKDNKKGKK